MNIFLVDFFVDGHHVEYPTYLCRHFLEQGHEVTFWTWQLDDRVQPLLDIGVNVRYVADRQATFPSQTVYMIPHFSRGLRRCLTAVLKEQADVVHLLYLDRAVLLPLWWNSFRRESRAHVFGTLFWPYHFLDHQQLSPFEKLYHRLTRTVLKDLLVRDKLTALFVHTERIKDMVLRTLELKSLAERCVVVPDPLPDAIFSPEQETSKQACRARLGLPQERTVLLFFGELRGGKGPDVLLEAAHLLPPEVLVVFAGNPMSSLPLDWEQEVKAQSLEGQVRCDLGRVPEELVPMYFQAADAVVLPYRRSFLGTSGVLQRAAAAKKPIIATDAGEVGDLVRRHGLGLVVDPEDPCQLGDAIKQYVSKREIIESQVAIQASSYITRNHWRQTGVSVLKVYHEAVSEAAMRSRPMANR
jgi:glycosyltransferase involved in cell wall biosynthesis